MALGLAIRLLEALAVWIYKVVELEPICLNRARVGNLLKLTYTGIG